METLQVERIEHGDWHLLVLRGPLDVATAPSFRQNLVEVQYAGGHRVAVDLREVEFLDSFGLGVLVGAVKRAHTHEGRFAVVVPADGRIRHVLDISGVASLVELAATRDELQVAGQEPPPAH